MEIPFTAIRPRKGVAGAIKLWELEIVGSRQEIPALVLVIIIARVTPGVGTHPCDCAGVDPPDQQPPVGLTVGLWFGRVPPGLLLVPPEAESVVT
ncbi:hypothetical protein GUJ93_ZPchr0007g3175 [Zizania palustris]|uniref:Uncharacterized protein n=1 Tax=Zizania palustris TaxID=103762 RepID=A0A8J5TE96_ZIZPA|nr:hypothetical protein GUJ93_ZPchr0007g3175 [Zizania palustris]